MIIKTPTQAFFCINAKFLEAYFFTERVQWLLLHRGLLEDIGSGNEKIKQYAFLFHSWNLTISSVIVPIVMIMGHFNSSLPYPGRRKKINLNLNFYFHTSLWCLKRFYEGLKGLHKTF